MDYRERKYYLAKFNNSTLDWWFKDHDGYGVQYDYILNSLKTIIPSLKIHSPYSHFKDNNDKYSYDGYTEETANIQHMLSCRLAYCNLLEQFFNDEKEKGLCVKLIEINKEKCGQ